MNFLSAIQVHLLKAWQKSLSIRQQDFGRKNKIDYAVSRGKVFPLAISFVFLYEPFLFPT